MRTIRQPLKRESHALRRPIDHAIFDQFLQKRRRLGNVDAEDVPQALVVDLLFQEQEDEGRQSLLSLSKNITI